MVQSNYPNISSVIDETKDLVNASLDDGPGLFVNEVAVVKIENEGLDFSTADNNREQVGFPSNFIDSKVEVDEVVTIAVERNDNLNSLNDKQSAMNRPNNLEKKEYLDTQSGQSMHQKDKKPAKFP